MKRALARQWAKALDSGDYEQTIGELRNAVGNQFCCLGVLCNIHAQEHPEVAKNELDEYQYLGESAILPSEVVAWAGMHGATGFFRDGQIAKTVGAASLVDCNDVLGMSFGQIAKILRKHWKDL